MLCRGRNGMAKLRFHRERSKKLPLKSPSWCQFLVLLVSTVVVPVDGSFPWSRSVTLQRDVVHQILPMKQTPLLMPLSLRGGCAGQKHDRKRSKKKILSTMKQRDTLISIDDIKDSTKDEQQLPTVRAILVPRPVNISLVIKWVSIAAFMVSMLFCVKTAGIPHMNAVKALINDGDTTNSAAVTPIQEFLAKRIASANGDILPPTFLPLPLPLLSLMASLGLWVGLTVLFPRWFMPIRVFLNYQSHDIADGDIENNGNLQNSIFNKKDAQQVDTGASVLVDIPRDQRDFESDGKASVIRPLYRSESECTEHTDNAVLQSHPLPFYFELNRRRIYCNPFDSAAPVIDGSPTLHSETPLQVLMSPAVTSGLCTPSRLQAATERFGPYASLSLPSPTISSAFLERISSPLVAMQIVGRLLNILEESVLLSLFNLFQTLLHHFWNAKRSIVSAGELAQEVKGNVEDTASLKVWALRPKRQKKKRSRRKQKSSATEWIEISAVDLLPGDVFVLGSLNEGVVMPVDALLLEGSCVASEAVLTGETVPQSKLPMDDDMVGETPSSSLDMMSKHRNSILFAGTSILHTAHQDDTADDGDNVHPPLPDALLSQEGASHVKLLALRTGSYSSRGELMRALARSRGHVGAISNRQTDRDALRLIVSLSFFALMACASLFVQTPFSKVIDGNSLPKKAPPFRRAVQCTRIAVASIPSDIPVCLSSVVQTCSMNLRKDADVACSEPGSLLTAAQVDVVVLDKTGTLTADTQSLALVVPPLSSKKAKSHPMVDAVLAGCHSLISLDGNISDDDSVSRGDQLVGDPLDLASLKHSGWTHMADDDSYKRRSKARKGAFGVSPPVRLWQLKTFPFDPSRRTSSAVILVLHHDGEYRLWAVVKGSPDVMQRVVSASNVTESAFDTWFEKKNRMLGAQGLRTLALGVKDLSQDSTYVDLLFPSGLSNLGGSSDQSFDINLSDAIAFARRAARSVHRNEVEHFGESDDHSKQLNFVGFACFDASIRPSTERVIRDIRRGGVKVVMLTGDGVDAAISVGRKAGLVDNRSVVVLDADNNDDLAPRVVLKSLKLPSKKRLERGHGVETVKTRALTNKSLNRAIQQASDGDCVLVATGKAVETLLAGNRKDLVTCCLLRNLSQFSIIARASPKVKREVVTCIRNQCGDKVLMCGDGVNDVAAMKVADVSVALLNGYGDESTTTVMSVDLEDDRRRQRLKQQRIGSNRKVIVKQAKLRNELEEAGIGDTSAASLARIKAHINDVLKGTKPSITGLFAAVTTAAKKERERKRKIQKGGGAAARIFAEEDRLRKSVLQQVGKNTAQSPGLGDDEMDISIIKPGEASLAASFSCLRPAIDGVDAIMRAGIAAAACALGVQQTIALNCLMACYNLATLYRDGFRYGKQMWSFELFFLAAIDRASYTASCSPRPKLSPYRPVESMFHPSSAISICSQAAIHLTTLGAGVNLAKRLESIYETSSTKTSPMIRWKGHGQSSKTPMSLLMNSLASIPSTQPDGDRRRGLGIFARAPFRPNFTTNVVFLLSIFQNTVTAIVNHKGKPFCGSILESRQFCIAAGASIFFIITCVSEAIPGLNEFLELRHLPSGKFRLALVALFLIDFISCFTVDRICTMFLNNEGQLSNLDNRQHETQSQTAADEEEALLLEETNANKMLLLGMLAITVKLLTDRK